MLLQRGYNDLGIQALLDETTDPQGLLLSSLQGQGRFRPEGDRRLHDTSTSGLDACLAGPDANAARTGPAFFRADPAVLSRRRIHGLPSRRARPGTVRHQRGLPPQRSRIASRRLPSGWQACLEEAKTAGEISQHSDVRQIANLLVDCWEGAALRSRLRRTPASLNAMLDFCFRSIATNPARF